MTSQITPIGMNRQQAGDYLGLSVQTIDRLRKVTLHALMGIVTMQAAAVVRAERGEVERVREVSRRVA